MHDLDKCFQELFVPDGNTDWLPTLTEKGEHAEEADALVQKALQLIELFVSKKADVKGLYL